MRDILVERRLIIRQSRGAFSLDNSNHDVFLSAVAICTTANGRSSQPSIHYA